MSIFSSKKEKKFFVEEHKWYFTPAEYTAEFRLRQRKLSTNHVHFLRELARFYFHKMIDNKKYVDPYFLDESVLTAEELELVNESKTFYEEIWDKYVPGLTPIDKGLNLIALLQKQNEQNGGGSNPTSKDLKGVDVEAALKRLPDKEIFESQSLNEIFDRREKIEDFDRKVALMNKIAMIERFGKTFEVKKEVAEKRVFNSKVIKQKRMVEYSEIINSPLYQRVLPNYNVKLLTKDLVVNTPVEYLESKQKIIMLVDYSGSMHNSEKQDWVLSLLADRLRYCCAEECEIFFSFFLTEQDIKRGNFKFTHIYNRETALKFFKEVSTNPSGGDTEIGRVIEVIRHEIMDNKRLFNLDIDLSIEKPEILIINDGQDTVKADEFNWKTNAITLFGNNAELKQLCERTGGKFVTVTQKRDGSHAEY